MRKVLLVALAALSATAFVAAPADAAGTPPPAGLVLCASAGSAKFASNMVLTQNPATKTNPLKATGTLSDCGAQTTGGVTTITKGSLEFSGLMPKGATCTSWVSGASTLANAKLTLRLDGEIIDNHGHTVTRRVATLRPTTVAIQVAGNGLSVSATVPQNRNGNAPFGGELISTVFNFDNLANVVDCTQGSAALQGVQWSTAGASYLSVTSVPAGAVLCETSGSATIDHPLPAGAPSTGLTTVEGLGTVGPCDTSGVSTNSWGSLINAGVVEFSAKVSSGVSCANLFTNVPNLSSTKMTITLQHAGPNAFGYTTTRTLGVIKTQIASIQPVGDGLILFSDPLGSRSPFPGQSIGVLLKASNLPAVADCAAGNSALSTLLWHAALGSSLVTLP